MLFPYRAPKSPGRTQVSRPTIGAAHHKGGLGLGLWWPEGPYMTRRRLDENNNRTKRRLFTVVRGRSRYAQVDRTDRVLRQVSSFGLRFLSRPHLGFMIENQRLEMSTIKQTLQYAFFFIVCLWFLYQIHYLIYVRRDLDCNVIDNRLIDERIAKALGRRGGLGKSHFSEEAELYGVDLIGAAVNVTDVGADLLSEEEPNLEGNGVVEVNNASVEEVMNAVILKKGENFGSLNGVKVRDSGPSKRTDHVEVKSERKRCTSIAKNQMNGKEGCRNASMQNGTEMVTVVESAKGSMRDLLLSEM